MKVDGLNYRGLDDECFAMIKEDSDLEELLKQVRQDPDCRIEVRDNYVNCYYRCGSMFKLTFNIPSRTLTFEFDPKYLELEKRENIPDGLEKWLKGRSKCPGEWLEKLGDLKQVMEAWFAEQNKQEKTMQQKLAEQNSFAGGKRFHVIDLELQIPGHHELGRMDMIAVRREGEIYIPVIIELKNGTKAFNGKSGILEHYKKTIAFLEGTDGDDPFNGETYLVETIRQIWKSKKKLELKGEQGPTPAAFGKTELMFAVTNWSGTPEILREKYLSGIEELDRTVWAAIFPEPKSGDAEGEYDLGASAVRLSKHKEGN